MKTANQTIFPSHYSGLIGSCVVEQFSGPFCYYFFTYPSMDKVEESAKTIAIFKIKPNN